jgi:hypothetical protein
LSATFAARMRIPTGDLVSSILQLRAAIRKTREPGTRAALRSIETDLRKLLGPSVSKRVAARALGVSPTALERWLGRGRLPLVRKNGSTRLELETGPFLDLAERVAALRSQGRRRPLSAAFASLGWSDDPDGPQILSEAVARLPRPNVSARELRERFRTTTPEERVRQAAALCRSLKPAEGSP